MLLETVASQATCKLIY